MGSVVSLLFGKTSLEKYIQTIEIDSDRIIAIKVCNSNISILVVQIYLPSSNHSLAEYKDEVDTLYDLCSLHADTSDIVILGDFNGNFYRNVTSGLTSRNQYLENFRHDLGLTVTTSLPCCTGPPYTFVPYNHSQPSRIDHILVNEQK